MKRTYYMAFLIMAIIFVSVFFVSEGREDMIDNLPDDSLLSYAGKNETEQRSVLGSKVIYMKYFTESNSFSVTYSPLDNTLAGKSRNELSANFPGWELIYMDDEKIILQQDINSYGPQTYIIGTTKTDEDEFVCVYSFDDMGEKSIHSIFDTPVMLFDEQTVQKLRNGIMVNGKESLDDALEDFGE